VTTPNLLGGVETFMAAARQPIPDKPRLPPSNIIAARLLMLLEELYELINGLGIDMYDIALGLRTPGGVDWLTDELDTVRKSADWDIAEIVDALLDITVVAYGGCLETAGLAGTRAAAAEVTRSNLAKILPDGTCRKREDGKVLKPEGWTPPDISAALDL